MKIYLPTTPVVFSLITLAFACVQSPLPIEDHPNRIEKISLSDCFVEVLNINLDDHPLDSYTPSRMRVKGVFGEDNENFALFDYALHECMVFNGKENTVERTFVIPKYDGWGEAHLLEVVALDSILYFDHEHQTLVVCNADEIKRKYNLRMDKDHHQPYQKIQHLHRFLRSIDGYIGFNSWIGYGEGGVNVDYDSLMDERNMVCFFKTEADTVISRDIPIQPYLRKTSFSDWMYYEVPFFEVNLNTREIVVFHCTTDTLYTYGWDNEVVKKHVVSGGDIKILPAKIPRNRTSEEILVAYGNQEQGFHYIYFDEESGKYLRYVVKTFPKHTVNGIPPRPEIRMLQILNGSFEVEGEIDLPDGYNLSKRVGNGIYLQKYDNDLRELRVFKFDWKQIEHAKLTTNE